MQNGSASSLDLVFGLPLEQLHERLRRAARKQGDGKRELAHFLVDMDERRLFRDTGHASTVHFAEAWLDEPQSDGHGIGADRERRPLAQWQFPGLRGVSHHHPHGHCSIAGYHSDRDSGHRAGATKQRGMFRRAAPMWVDRSGYARTAIT